MMLNSSVNHRLAMAGGHLSFSLLVAAFVAVLAFGIWYPEPFRTLSGGLRLFIILVLVDVISGPLATAVVSSPGKSVREWRMDIALIVVLQLGALGYGLWTLHQARPVYVAFEVDRLRVVHAVDVDEELLKRAPEGLQTLPQWGPRLVAVRPFRDAKENMEATMAALGGVELGFRPDLWTPYEHALGDLQRAALPLANLLQRHPTHANAAQARLEQLGLSVKSAAYLPLHSRTTFWTAVIDTTTFKPVFYLDLDPYSP